MVKPESETVIPADFAVIAHRGWSGSYPENTLLALHEAIRAGSRFVEFDVAMTRDRRLIVIHDDTLERTTNGTGAVREQNFPALRRLDAGRWLDPRFAGLRPPSLDEVLVLARRAGIRVNIEIKSQCFDEARREDGVEHQVLRAVRRRGLAGRTIISSFHWPILERIRDLDPTQEIALLYEEALTGLDPGELKRRYGMTAFNSSKIHMTRDFVSRCHAEGIRVFLFTVNSYLDMEQYLDMGVDGVFTNHPSRFERFLETHRRRLNDFLAAEARENQADQELAARGRAEQIAEKQRVRAGRGRAGRRP